MINYIRLIPLIVAAFMSKLNASDMCVWQPEAGLLAIKGLSNVCSIDFENELLDLNELTIIEDKSEGSNPGGIYKDKYGNIWFIKESIALREYVGGHILELFLGSGRIAEIKLVKGYPSLVASKKLENFYPMQTLIKSEQATSELDGMYPLLNNYEELLVGMNYVGLGDRHSCNQGYIKKNEALEAARVDYDYSFIGKVEKSFFSKELFKAHVDYGKLEEAVIKLLNLPDDQIHQILENGAHLEFFDESVLNTKFITDGHNHLVNYLEERKKNLKQLLPLIACLRKVLNEGDISYLSENKDMLIAFQNAVEPDSRLSYLNMLMHQVVQRGCLEALKKLKELGFYEYSENGYGVNKEELLEVAYKAKQDEVLDYLLGDDKVPLVKTLYVALKNKDYEFARKLINENIFLRPGVIGGAFLDHMLRWSVESNDLNLVKGIVRLGADIKKSRNTLYAALNMGSSFEIFQYLLENGAKEQLSVRSDLIHNAAQKKRADVVELFVQYGADPYLRDRDGKTAYDYLN